MATIVIMAAGLGSRFSQNETIEAGHGGNKQVAYVDEYNNCIMHYSIHDAIKAGFDKIILIIRKKDQEIFDRIIGTKFGDKVDIQYAYQEMDDLKEQGLIPADRMKPMGTTHAVLSAKSLITDESFAVINADDYYGPEAYENAIEFMNSNPGNFSIIAYQAKNVLSPQGPVKRGICLTNDEGVIDDIKESTVIRDENGMIIATPINGEPSFQIEEDTPISMSFFVLPTACLDLLEEDFSNTIKTSTFDKEKGERLIHESVTYAKNKMNKPLYLKNCSAVWMGLTYKEDLPKVKENLAKLKNMYSLIQK